MYFRLLFWRSYGLIYFTFLCSNYGFIFTQKSVDTKVDYLKSSFGSAISAFHDSSQRGYIVGAPRAGKQGKVFKCVENSVAPLRCEELTNLFLKKPFLGSNFTDSLLGSTIVPYQNGFVICAPNTRSETSKVLLTGHCFYMEMGVLNRVMDIRATSCLNLHNSPETHPPTYRNCQFGFSTSISNKSLLVSTPLYISGRGIGEITDDLKIFKTSSTESVMPNQMLGYSSATSTNVNHDGTEFIVLGGPGISEKYEDTEIGGPEGIVRIFSKDESVDYILQGKDFASAFGTSVLLIDINNDKLDDLIVGSPQQLNHLDKKTIGRHKYGAVHVFINRNNLERPFDFGENEFYYQILPPDDFFDRSLFGSALNKLGDINSDNYQDFSISAPANQRKGSVLIYLGSANGLINQPVQIITGTENDSGFGSSLSVNQIDLNDDKILDLAIGSPLADTLSIFFGRNPIRISFEHEKRPIKCGQITGYQANNKCEEITFTGYYQTTTQKCLMEDPMINLVLQINPDVHLWNEGLDELNQFYQNANVIVEESDWPLANYFLDGEVAFESSKMELQKYWKKNSSSLDNVREIMKNGFLFKSVKLNCQHGDMSRSRATTNIRLITRDKDLQGDILLGLKWTLNDSPKENPDVLRNPSRYPVINPKDNTRFISLVTIPKRSGELKLSTEFNLNSEFDQDGPVIFVNKKHPNKLVLKVSVRNNGKADVEGLSMLTRFEENIFKSRAGQDLKNGVALCKFSPRIPNDSMSECNLEFEVAAFDEFSQPFTYMNTTIYRNMLKTNITTAVEKINMKLFVYVKAQSSIEPSTTYFSGNISGTVGTQNGENSVGNTKIKYSITLTSQKVDTGIGKSKLIINWPYELTGDVNEDHGPYMLYLLEYPRYTYQNSQLMLEKNLVTCEQRSLDRITNIYQKKLLSRETKKDEFVSVSPEIEFPQDFIRQYPEMKSRLEIVEEDNKLTTELSCRNGQVRCIPIVCEIDQFNYKISPLKISFEARIWEDTNRIQFKNIHLATLLLEAGWYPDSDFQIVSHPEYEPSTSVGLKMFNNMRKAAVPPKLKPLYLALGVIAGLVLLGILVVILIAAGFFKRKREPRKLSDL